MFIVGKANKMEIKSMEKLGFEVEEIDVKMFDKAFKNSGEFCEDDYCGDDKMVAIFIDCDVLRECQTIIALEKFVNTVTGD